MFWHVNTWFFFFKSFSCHSITKAANYLFQCFHGVQKLFSASEFENMACSSLLAIHFVGFEAFLYGAIPVSFSVGSLCYIFPEPEVGSFGAFWLHRCRHISNYFSAVTCNPSRKTSTQAELWLCFLGAVCTLMVSSKKVLPESVPDAAM